MGEGKRFRIGTRGSRLALVQAKAAAAAFETLGARVEIVEIATSGDTDRRDLWRIGGQGVFTAALESALAEGRTDAAVHSAKDLPTRLAPGLVLAAALPREDVRDALVSRAGLRLMDLPAGAKVGTSSARRAAAVLALRPDLEPVPIRGNVPTRVEKVMRGEFDAAVLAVAGLKRLGMEAAASEVFDTDTMLPAAGQAAIVVEVREDDDDARVFCERMNHPDTLTAVTAERAVLAALDAGCRMPVGVLAERSGAGFRLRVHLLSEDGRQSWRAETTFAPGEEERAAAAAASALDDSGAPRNL